MRPWLWALLFSIGCHRSTATVPGPTADAGNDSPGREIANQRLHDHIVTDHRPVFVEHLGQDFVWSDGALIERARTLPPPEMALVASPPIVDGSAPRSMVAFLDDLDRRRAEWHLATLRRSGPSDADCAVTDGAMSATLDCRYVNYLEGRYPLVTFLLKAPTEPVLVVDGPTLRGALMPLKGL